MNMRSKIIDLISEAGIGYIEKSKTIFTTCPSCGQSDKFSILKANGSGICYRGSCDFSLEGKGRPFEQWLALTLNIDESDAKRMMRNSKYKEDELNVNHGIPEPIEVGNPFDAKERDYGLTPVVFPEMHMLPISDIKSIAGLTYLAKRGISLETAAKYDIYYSVLHRRVYFPIKINDTVYGYQGRHIDDVPNQMRMRNNEGFARAKLVMFADNLQDSEFAIMTEGPFDALKFDHIGSNICTMGKSVTDQQIKLIESYGIGRLYLALDDDAVTEMIDISLKTCLSVYLLQTPKSCIDRCAVLNKKADFGECTAEETTEAFHNARPLFMPQVKNE